MTDNNHILFAEQKDLAVFKLVGELRHTESMGLEAVIKELFESGAEPHCRDVLVDLNEVRYMDSTILGLLAMIARFSIKKLDRKPSLLCKDADVLEVISSMCLDQVFLIIGDSDTDQSELALKSLETMSADDKARAEVILHAHQSLMELSDTNRQTFKPVVDLMRKDLNA